MQPNRRKFSCRTIGCLSLKTKSTRKSSSTSSCRFYPLSASQIVPWLLSSIPLNNCSVSDEAKFISSNKIQSPFLRACTRDPLKMTSNQTLHFAVATEKIDPSVGMICLLTSTNRKRSADFEFDFKDSLSFNSCIFNVEFDSVYLIINLTASLYFFA